MIRILSILFFSVLMLLGIAESAFAQSWPAFPYDVDQPHRLDRGTGGYFSVWKFSIVVVVYFLWVKIADWVNRDCQILKMNHVMWNTVMFWPFLAGLFLVFLIPVYLGGLPVLLLTFFGPTIAYVVTRNGLVQPHERVCTPAHLRFLFSQGAKSIGMKVNQEKKAAHEKGAPVTFTATDGNTNQKKSNEINARQSEGFLPTKALVKDIVDQRSEKVMMDFSSNEVSTRFQIDGVWHESESQDRESGDQILATLKTLANLKVQERKKRQAGNFLSEYQKVKYKSTIVSQGTKTGERVILQLAGPMEGFEDVKALGMRPKMAEQLAGILAGNGMVILSSTPGNGLSTSLSIGLKLTDRYMRDFVALQEVLSQEPLAENIDTTLWSKAKGDIPEKELQTLIRKEPDGVVVTELPNTEVVKMLCEQATREKLIVTTVRAKEAVEALLRVLLLKVPANELASAVTAVVNQRLVRRLCEDCKEAYEPSPALLKKLGIPAGRIESLYRPPDPAEQPRPCETCNGIGYKGRSAIFELLVVDQTIREALIKQPKLEILRQVARKAGHRNLQQEGIVQVAQGITSLAELQRVLKQ